MDITVVTKALELAIAGGLGAVAKNLFDYFTRRAEARTPAAIETSELAVADKAVIAAGHQIDGLLKDNDRLRHQLGQERDHFEKERLNFDRREAALRAEIDRLECQLKKVLSEIQALKLREFGE